MIQDLDLDFFDTTEQSQNSEFPKPEPVETPNYQ